MNTKKPPKAEEKPPKSEPEVHVHDVSKLRGHLKVIGGSTVSYTHLTLPTNREVGGRDSGTQCHGHSSMRT